MVEEAHVCQSGGIGRQAGVRRGFNNWWDGPYNGVTPTKLPAGRLEITLDSAQQTVKQFELNLATAEGIAASPDGQKLDAFFSAADRSRCCGFRGRSQRHSI